MWPLRFSCISIALGVVCLVEAQRCQDEQQIQIQPMDYTQCGRPVCASNGFCYRKFANICLLNSFNLQLIFSGQRELVQSDMRHCLPRPAWNDYNASHRPRPLAAAAYAYANTYESQYPYDSEPYNPYRHFESQDIYSPTRQNTYGFRNDYKNIWDRYSGMSYNPYKYQAISSTTEHSTSTMSFKGLPTTEILTAANTTSSPAAPTTTASTTPSTTSSTTISSSSVAISPSTTPSITIPTTTQLTLSTTKSITTSSPANSSTTTETTPSITSSTTTLSKIPSTTPSTTSSTAINHTPNSAANETTTQPSTTTTESTETATPSTTTMAATVSTETTTTTPATTTTNSTESIIASTTESNDVDAKSLVSLVFTMANGKVFKLALAEQITNPTTGNKTCAQTISLELKFRGVLEPLKFNGCLFDNSTRSDTTYKSPNYKPYGYMYGFVYGSGYGHTYANSQSTQGNVNSAAYAAASASASAVVS